MLKRNAPFPRRPRLESFDYRGPHAYFLTINVKDRRPALANAPLCALLRAVLLDAAERFAFGLEALCFMPDHVHLLVSGWREDSDLKRFVRRFKQATGYAYKRRHGERLWAYSYYDHVLRREESLEDVAHYLLANPVRAGLVERWEEYPYSECRMLGKRFGVTVSTEG